MERLLEDAGKLANTKFDISNYADVIQAIHTIQENLGITGTTAKEAADTIEGSMNSTKAALDNLITGFARSDADIDKLMGDVEENVRNLAKNAIPVAEKAFVTMAKTAIEAGKEIADELPRLIRQATTDVHKMIKETFGEGADTIFGIEAALKAAAAAFVTFKAAAYVADVVEKIKALNTALQGTVTLSEAMNAANLANPWVLAATAIAAATVGLKSWVDAQTDAINEVVNGYDSLTDAQKEAYDGMQALLDEVTNSRNEWNKTADTLETNAKTYEGLMNELFKLDEQENISNENKVRMKAIVDELNGSIDGLNIKLNEQNGHLETEKSSIEDLIVAYNKKAKATATQERLVELYKRQYELDDAHTKILKEHEAAEKKLNDLKAKRAAAEKRIQEIEKNQGVWTPEIEREYGNLNVAIKQLSEEIETAADASGHLAEKQVAASEAANANTAEIQKNVDILVEMNEVSSESGLAIEESAKAIVGSMMMLQEEAGGLAETTEGFWLTMKDGTHVLSVETAEQVGALIDQYDKLYEAQYQSIAKTVDLYKGFEADTSTTYNDLLNNLKQSEFYLNDWTTAIEQLQDKVDKGLMSQNFLDSLKDMGLDSWNIVYNMNHATGEQLKEYSDIWDRTNESIKESTDRLTEEQKANTEKQLEELTGIANANIDDYRKAFSDVGVAIGDGLVVGIKDKVKEVEAEIKEVGEGVIQVGKDTLKVHSPSEEFRDIGVNIVDGLIVGISEKSKYAEDTIRALSQRLIRAMREELDIKSPSKIMQELGGYVSEGFAIGIEEQADRAEKAVKEMSANAVNAVESSMSVPSYSSGYAASNYKKVASYEPKEAQSPISVETLTAAFKEALKDLVSGNIEVTGTLDGEKLLSLLFPKIDALQGERVQAAIRGYAQ